MLLKTECGHCGGPTCGPPAPLPPLLDARPFRHGIFGHPLTSLPDTPETIQVAPIILGVKANEPEHTCSELFNHPMTHIREMSSFYKIFKINFSLIIIKHRSEVFKSQYLKLRICNIMFQR